MYQQRVEHLGQSRSTTPKTIPGLVSVVVTTYNHGHYLLEALTSVQSQTYNKWEIVVVDDGSEDDSTSIALKFADEHDDRQITIVRCRNGGPSYARNTGIALARGEYILPLDADDWLEPEMLSLTVVELNTHKNAMIATGGFKNIGGSGDCYHPPPYTFAREIYRNVIPSCSLFRRTGWESTGGYDEQMRGYEDWDFWITLAKLGPVIQIRKVLFNYRHSNHGMYAYSVERDLPLRAHIVRNHPDIYDEPAQKLAEKILRGDNLDDILRTQPVHPIFHRSYRCRQLRPDWRDVDPAD